MSAAADEPREEEDPAEEPDVSRMDEILAGLMDEADDFVPAIVAAKAVAQLREKEPGVLNDWLDDNAEHFLRLVLTERLRGIRSAARHHSTRRAFASAAKRAEEGDLEGLRHFETVYEVAPDHTRRRLGDMTGADHQFVADRYGQRANTNKFHQAFHQALARKCADRKTSACFTEEAFDTFQSDFYRRNQPPDDKTAA